MDAPTLIVVGAGPAGLAAALAAAKAGIQVRLLERQSEAGQKLLLTGNGQCNITNQADMEWFYGQYFGNGAFLRPSFQFLSNTDLLTFLQQRGLRFRTTPEGKVFPVPPKAAVIRDEWVQACREAGVRIEYGQQVREIEPVTSVRQTATRFRVLTAANPSGYAASALVLTTGGLSYPATGSTGDGHRWLERFGVPMIPVRPALAPLRIRDPACGALAGVTVDPVVATLFVSESGGHTKKAGQASGSLLFTHTGVSGPVILRLSRDFPAADHGAGATLRLDFFPEEKLSSLEARVARRLADASDKNTINAISGLLPASLLRTILVHCGFQPDRLTRMQPAGLPKTLAARMKRLEWPIAEPPSYRQAMVTAGGVSLKAVNPRTLAVNSVPGLYVAGELLDIDGDTGGFNLQAAFSTGALAGCRAAEFAGYQNEPAPALLDLFA